MAFSSGSHVQISTGMNAGLSVEKRVRAVAMKRAPAPVRLRYFFMFWTFMTVYDYLVRVTVGCSAHLADTVNDLFTIEL